MLGSLLSLCCQSVVSTRRLQEPAADLAGDRTTAICSAGAPMTHARHMTNATKHVKASTCRRVAQVPRAAFPREFPRFSRRAEACRSMCAATPAEAHPGRKTSSQHPEIVQSGYPHTRRTPFRPPTSPKPTLNRLKRVSLHPPKPISPPQTPRTNPKSS